MYMKAFKNITDKLPTIFLVENKKDLKTIEDAIKYCTPTHPYIARTVEEDGSREIYCPREQCGCCVDDTMSFCPDCGQALNWEWEDE